ncbi:hypothetical protein DLAC_06601 [Tieghemostelium lacteum]|uniref:Endonuclease/exonuclease/phosphatase domain-containing protein n=1 Tax=Tieghemostelium lacteum TaxID=361077 RepID=A0A151ZFA1_TIELA|nr:hypothetical protein DLAC_06601 [Tieghemostelium lacteum]|eukprot:KYQ92607.1 hypothetical protein DLAC_06601 [Tieghemostelium lacteum]
MNDVTTPRNEPVGVIPPPPPITKIKLKTSSSGDNIDSNTTGTIQQLLQFNRRSLNSTKTQVRTPDGRVYEERICSGGLVSEYKGIDENLILKKYTSSAVLSPFIYSITLNKWIVYNYKLYPHQILDNNQTKLSFITYNVWFDSFLWKERANELFKILSHYQPDIICLQEVTPTFLDYIKDQVWLRNSYCISDNGDFDTVFPYGVLMLIKYKTVQILKFSISPLPGTNQSRKVLRAICKLNNNTVISISTVHLESLDQNSDCRIKQLEFIQQQQQSHENLDTNAPHQDEEPYNHTFLLGDFNFGSSAKENEFLNNNNDNSLPYLRDMWMELNRNNSNLNQNNNSSNYNNQISQEINNSNNEQGFTYIKKRKRVDRIVFKSNNQIDNQVPIETLIPISISLIGSDPIYIDITTRLKENLQPNEPIYPSDHFGLYGVFEIQK